MGGDWVACWDGGFSGFEVRDVASDFLILFFWKGSEGERKERLISSRDGDGKEVEFKEVYRVVLKGEELGKEVRYWVAVVRGEQEVRVQEVEVAGAEWVGWDEAEERISFESAKVMVRRVRELLGREN